MSVMNTGVNHSEGTRFYGWRVLAAVFVGEMFALGCTAYAFTLFVGPISRQLGLSRATANTGMMLILFGMGLAAPLVGRLLDRFPARYILAGGALYMGSGFIVLGLASSPWVMAGILFLVVGPGATAIGPLSAATIVSRWFDTRRGRALGIAAVGTSLGGAILVPAIGFTMSLIGWRGSLLLEGVVIATLISAIALLVVREPPAPTPPPVKRTGAAAPPQSDTPEHPAWRITQILRNPQFWFITITVGLIFAISQAVIVSLVPLGLRAGLGTEQAALLVSLLAGVAILAKLGFGTISDWFNKRDILVIITFILLLEMTLWWTHTGPSLLVAAVVLDGIAVGGALPVWQALVAERFGKRSYGAVLGCMQVLISIGCGASLYFAGHTYDVTGSYDRMFLAFMLAIVLAIVSAVLIPADRHGWRSNGARIT